uniref:(northern house mosquito) hypothetical protein n=1 Tax=Culex pipiens TaxID=7175 RepID=A0A8D8FHB8_CULPI
MLHNMRDDSQKINQNVKKEIFFFLFLSFRGVRQYGHFLLALLSILFLLLAMFSAALRCVIVIFLLSFSASVFPCLAARFFSFLLCVQRKISFSPCAFHLDERSTRVRAESD